MLRLVGAVVLAAGILGVAGSADARKDKHSGPPPTKINKVQYDKIDYSSYARRRAELEQGDKPAARNVLGLDPAEFGRVHLGRGIDLAEGESIIDDPAILRAIEEIRDRLLDAWPIKPPERPEIKIILTDGSVYNPHSTPLGEIVINQGVLSATKSVDELTYVMGHELSHVLMDHFKSLENKKRLDQSIRIGAWLGSVADKAAHGGQTTLVTQTGLKVSVSALTMNEYFIGPQWNRTEETFADLLGFDLLVQAGRNAEGARHVFERLRAANEAQKKARKKICQKQAAAKARVNPLAPLQWGLNFLSTKSTGDPCSPSLFDLTVKALLSKKKYPNIGRRVATLENYINTRYPILTYPAIVRYGENNLFSFLSPDGPMARGHRASQALDAMLAGNLKEARRLADSSITGADDKLAKPRYASYKIYRAMALEEKDETARQALINKGIQDLEIAASGSPFRQIYVDLAAEYAGRGTPEGYELAIKTLNRAGYRFNDFERFYPLNIRYLALSGDTLAAEDIWLKCVELRRPAIRSQCKREAKAAGIRVGLFARASESRKGVRKKK